METLTRRASPPDRPPQVAPRVARHELAEPTSWYARRGKRWFDIAAAVTLGVVALPAMALVALIIVATMGRPVLFLQQRLGHGGRQFNVMKFRTMHGDRRTSDQPFSGTDRRRTHKSTADPRHTRVGRILRATGLDELPQLLNVMRGDMSLVGPRPEIVAVAVRSGIADHRRHTVRPGITGAWQLSDDRRRPIAEHLGHDEWYVDHVSMRTDARLLARTAIAAIKMRGA